MKAQKCKNCDSSTKMKFLNRGHYETYVSKCLSSPFCIFVSFIILKKKVFDCTQIKSIFLKTIYIKLSWTPGKF